MLTFGADPEIVIEKDQRLLPAHKCLIFESDFGRDGNSSTAELRPHYGKNTIELVANIRRLIKDGVSKIKALQDCRLLAGHYKYDLPIGGHIHIAGFSGSMDALGSRLDLVLGTLSDCIDDLEEREARRADGYGSGWRTDTPHGGIEYRMPGSWLLSPHVAFLNLWLAEATTYAFVNKQETPFKTLEELGGCEGLIAFAQEVKNVNNKEVFFAVADKVFSNLPLDWWGDVKEAWL